MKVILVLAFISLSLSSAIGRDDDVNYDECTTHSVDPYSNGSCKSGYILRTVRPCNGVSVTKCYLCFKKNPSPTPSGSVCPAPDQVTYDCPGSSPDGLGVNCRDAE